MANISIYNNARALPTGAPLPFKPISRNFYVLIAQCEEFTGCPASFINPNIAFIPLSESERLVVML